MKTTYRYNGPDSGGTLDDGTDVLLWEGKDIDLPPDDSYVQTLVALGYLTEKKPDAPAKAKKDKEHA